MQIRKATKTTKAMATKTPAVAVTAFVMTMMMVSSSSSSSSVVAVVSAQQQQQQCNKFTEPSQLQKVIDVLSTSGYDPSSSVTTTICLEGPGFDGGSQCVQNSTINIPASVGPLTLVVVGDEPDDGEDASTTFTPFSFGCSSINVESGAELTLTSNYTNGFTFTSFDTPTSPIVIEQGGVATLTNVFFDGTTSSTNGGAIENLGTLTINDGNFLSCTASVEGGTIYTGSDSSLTINGAYISLDQTTSPDPVIGTAVYADEDSTIELNNVEIVIGTTPTEQDQQNSLVFAPFGDLTVKGCGLSGNAAPQSNNTSFNNDYGFLFCDCETGCNDNPPCTDPNGCNNNGGSGSDLSSGAIAGIVVGSVVGLIVVVAIAMLTCRRCRRSNEENKESSSPAQQESALPR